MPRGHGPPRRPVDDRFWRPIRYEAKASLSPLKVATGLEHLCQIPSATNHHGVWPIEFARKVGNCNVVPLFNDVAYDLGPDPALIRTGRYAPSFLSTSARPAG
jgi:hypothetical protein